MTLTGDTSPRPATSVLVVDDEEGIRRALELNLRARGFEVLLAASGEEALAVAAGHHPAGIILDLGLPGMSGLDVIQELRKWSAVPIVVLSARDAEADKVRSLDLGADDYVTKPFGIEELLARLRAALRRYDNEPQGPQVIVTEELAIDLTEKKIAVAGVEVHLTPTEWRLLEVLLLNQGRLVSQRELLDKVWGQGYETQINYLRVYVGTLRQKLERSPSTPRHLLTEPGIGYRFIT